MLIEQTEKKTLKKKTGKMLLVDLAGSESREKTVNKDKMTPQEMCADWRFPSIVTHARCRFSARTFMMRACPSTKVFCEPITINFLP